MPLQTIDPKALALGAVLKAGPLLKNLDPDLNVMLKVVERQETKMTFTATYSGIFIGEVYYNTENKTWKTSWR